MKLMATFQIHFGGVQNQKDNNWVAAPIFWRGLGLNNTFPSLYIQP